MKHVNPADVSIAYAVYYKLVSREGVIGHECSLHPTVKSAAAYSQLHEGPDVGFEVVPMREKGKLVAKPVGLSKNDYVDQELRKRRVVTLRLPDERELEPAGRPVRLGPLRSNRKIWKLTKEICSLRSQSGPSRATQLKLDGLYAQVLAL